MPKGKRPTKATKTQKQHLPKGALQEKHWNVQPEKKAAFYTAVSQLYFQEMLMEHFPSAGEFFDAVKTMIEVESIYNGYTGWKSLAYQWVEFLNALTFHNNKSFHYHLEANIFIADLEPEEFPMYHRTLSISSAMMDHMSFTEALKLWKELRIEIPESMKVFKFREHHYEWSTPTKLVDINKGKVLTRINDARWEKLKPTSQVNPPLQIQLISYDGGDKPN